MILIFRKFGEYPAAHYKPVNKAANDICAAFNSASINQLGYEILCNSFKIEIQEQKWT